MYEYRKICWSPLRKKIFYRDVIMMLILERNKSNRRNRKKITHKFVVQR
nr:MAG TPA: hypothetical protein [Caudoviricetes sp.]